MNLNLDGRVVIVTAAGSGIGLATAKAFAAEGALVLGADLDPSALNGRPAVSPFQLDMLAPDSGDQLVAAALAQHGRVDVLVNAVGGLTARPGGFVGIDDEAWRRSLDLNFMSMVRACRAVIPHMQAQGGGSIVSIASDAGRQPTPAGCDYCVAKAAILSLSKSLSIEYAPSIRCNAVSPGPTRTPGFVGVFDRDIAPAMGVTTDEAIDHFVANDARIPSGRLGEPEDVAAVILFLGSDLSRQVTGSEYCVNGGTIRAA